MPCTTTARARRAALPIAIALAVLAAQAPAQAHAAVEATFARGGSRLGGGATIDDAGSNAFGYPAPLLSATERRAFAVGNSFFKQNWVTAPASTKGRDGLGPLFNARSCSACHGKDGRSRPPEADERERHGLLMRIGVAAAAGADLAHPAYGAQIQDEAILGVLPEARVEIAVESRPDTFADGTPFELQAPTYTLRDLAYGPLGDGVALSPRTAPQLVGLGLLEAIPAAAIEALADPDDRDGDGISGRVHRVAGADGAPRLGRFGWKAAQPDVRTQTAAAFVNDMGITSPLQPREVLTGIERERIAAADEREPDIADRAFERVVFYARTLAVPAQRDAAQPQVVAGRRSFAAFGCAACHVPEFVTGDVDFHAAFGGQTIRPFTDLLLHDLGPGLADGKRDGDAGRAEWRTAPLWGIGLIPVVNGHSRYLHDGRARDLTEAVLWHGGEAAAAKERFRRAPRAERDALLAFLRSL